MHSKQIYTLLLVSLMATAPALAQSTEDSVAVDRTVYVQRDFQPTVQSAGKIAVKPAVFEPTIEYTDPVYSNYNQPLSLGYTVQRIDFAGLNFRQPDPLRGYLQAGFGHVNSLFQFNYRVTDAQMQHKKKNTSNDLVLDIYANHLGQWGRKTLSQSNLGFDFSKQFSKAEFYFGAEGSNDFFTRYGVYYIGDEAFNNLPNASRKGLNKTSVLTVDHFSEIDPAHRQTMWGVNTRIGVRNLPNADVQYCLQTGYEAFIMPSLATEHQIHTYGNFFWGKNYHNVGVEADIQNRLYTTSDTALVTKANHRIHIQPYYAYKADRWRIHAGINFDFSAGRGRTVGISPDVTFEADITKTWLAFYASATGNYEANGAAGEYAENRYRSANCLFADTLSGTYTPIDANLGFKIRPYETLIIDVHAGYALMLDKHVNVFGKEAYGYYEHELQNVQRVKVGLDLQYHYRDIVAVTLGGHYFAWSAAKRDSVQDCIGDLRDAKGKAYVFDAPKWEVHFRVDAKINQKWALYSDNYFGGGRKACIYDNGVYKVTGEGEIADMPKKFDLNLGVQYNVDRWLSVYFQLNNYLAWNNKLTWYTFYGYEVQRANCMFGLSWSF